METNIDYKALYEEARERAKEALDTLPTDNETVVFHIFPDLKESEDERIRKALVKHFQEKKNCVGDTWAGLNVDDVLAYLERQKEQNLVLEPHKGDKDNPYDMSYSEAQEYVINRGFYIPWSDCYVFIDKDYMTQTVANILRWADEHPKEQKPAEWSEEDECSIQELIQFVMNWKAKAKDFTSKAVIWTSVEADCDRYISALKSLRPHSQWKPSEEQIKALEIVGVYGRGEMAEHIRSLYTDLLKLG
jgi:hypothetical protein